MSKLSTLNSAPSGLVKIIRNWKRAFKEWNDERDPADTAVELGINYDTYRRYLGNYDHSFPYDSREKLYQATKLDCFSPHASRNEVAGILKGLIPYGAEGWQTALKKWKNEQPRGRGPRVMQRATGIGENTLQTFYYDPATSYPTNFREKFFEFTQLPHFREPQESYKEDVADSSSLEQLVTAIPPEERTTAPLEKIAANITELKEMIQEGSTAYLNLVQSLGKLVGMKNGPHHAVQVLLENLEGSSTKKAQIAAGLFYTLVEFSSHLRRDEKLLFELHKMINPTEAGYLMGFINAIARGGDSLGYWAQIQGMPPEGLKTGLEGLKTGIKT